MNTDKKVKILCVDDDLRNLKLLEAVLTPRGYDIILAENGQEALTKTCSVLPDLILMDIMMPKMNGLEATKQLKASEKTKFIPIILITALQETTDRIKGIEAGCDDFISKPFDRHELLARIKSLLRIKLLQDKVNEDYEKLLELETLKDSLLHMLIHDLNNPLVSVAGYLQLLQIELENTFTQEQKDDLERALVSSRELKRMLGNLLDINRMEENQIELVRIKTNIAELAKEVVDQMTFISHADKKALSLKISGNIPDVSMDIDIIKRVIANLISNSIKYTPSGESIDVLVSHESDTNNLRVEVKDTGNGIPEEYIDKIFDKFARIESDKTKPGRGLGLTFCKMMIEAHGGKIWVESNPKKGSVFIFTLPCGK